MKKLANYYSEYYYKYDREQDCFIRCTDPDGYLFSRGRYRTKIRAEDLPEWYVYGYLYKLHGYMSAKGVKYMVYCPNKHTNHMFKDDFLYISYDRPIVPDESRWERYSGFDEYVFGGVILDFLLAAEKYSGYDISGIKAQIEEKRQWFKATYPEFYRWENPQDKPFFD